MQNIGPSLEILIRRLVDIPPDFLDEPKIGNQGQVVVAALVNDLLRWFGARPSDLILARFRSSNTGIDRNRLALVMIVVWLLADEWFIAAGIPQHLLVKLLDETPADLASTTPAHKFVTDPDRREELARTVLARLNFRPKDETLAQATDRLSSISGSERKRLLEASRAAEHRARAIREALAKKAAEESADKWTRE